MFSFCICWNELCIRMLLLLLCVLFVFFFVKQKTAYEMRISDWSSDVCSSDLRHAVLQKRIRGQPLVRREALARIEAQLAQRLANEGLQHRLVSRVKSPWSIYNKMQAEGKTFTQVMDVFGFRIIVGTVADRKSTRLNSSH